MKRGTPRVSSNYIRGFDGLRALAVGAVMADHLSIPGFSYGWLGVPLFFVLSGFLITGILYDGRNGPAYFSRFYTRRAVRILPIYFLVIALILIAGGMRHWAISDWPWFAFLLENWKLGVEGWSGKVAFPPFLYHGWSLAVEEQFYLLWPLVIAALSPRAFRAVLALVIVSAAVFRVMITPYVAEPFWLLPADLLGWGAVGALLIRSHIRISTTVLALGVAGAGIGCILLARTAWLVPLSGPLFLGVLLLVERGVATGMLELRPLRYLGRISYGLYLYHLPTFVFLAAAAHRWAPGLQPVAADAIKIAAAVAVAVLSYHLIERPLLRRVPTMRQPEQPPVRRAESPGKPASP